MNQRLQDFYLLLSGNDALSLLAIVVLSSLLTLVFKFILKKVSHYLRRLAEQSETIWDDIGVDLLDGLKSGVVFAWILYLMTKTFHSEVFLHKILLIGVVTLSVFQVWLWGHHLISNWRNAVLKKKIQEDPSSAAALGLLYTAIQVGFISVLVLIGLSNLGIDIGALLAGLGVGGIAVALAAQNILGDLLASLSIVLDKPFIIGDFIVTGEEKGRIEHIGITSTRLRSLSGEEVILSNKKLMESRIHNYKRMWRRRVEQRFGVIYNTPVEMLERIPGFVRSFIEKHPQREYDRCHFAKYGDSSLDFELVFYVSDPDYNIFMDLQEKVLLDIFRKFTQEGISFAFPTQTIYIEKLPFDTQIGSG